MGDLDKYLKHIRILAYSAAPKVDVVDVAGLDQSDYFSELMETAWRARQTCIDRHGLAMPFERNYVERACTNRLYDLMRSRRRVGGKIFANNSLVNSALFSEDFEATAEARESLGHLRDNLEPWRWDLLSAVGIAGVRGVGAAAESVGRSTYDVRRSRQIAARLLA